MMWPNASWQWQVENKEQDLLGLGSCVEQQQLKLTRLRLDIVKKFLHQKNHATLEQAVQTGCRIDVLGGFQYSTKQSYS